MDLIVWNSDPRSYLCGSYAAIIRFHQSSEMSTVEIGGQHLSTRPFEKHLRGAISLASALLSSQINIEMTLHPLRYDVLT